MKIITISVGELQTNCYALINDNNECIIVDPGAEGEKIKTVLKDYLVVGIWITHSHHDHIGAKEELEEYYNVTSNNFEIPTFEVEVIKTPGHRFDSLTFYFKEEKIMFTGDFLFQGTIGRLDLEGSSFNEMLDSLNKIKKYPKDILVYPGHGDSTSLLEETDVINYYINWVSNRL